MNGTGNRLGWGARLLIALVFILVGAGAAIWGLAHYPPAARVLGVAPPAPQPIVARPKPVAVPPAPPTPAENGRIAALEQRLSAVEGDRALAAPMRMPGAARAGAWIAKARRYVAVHRALDEIESAALLAGPGSDR